MKKLSYVALLLALPLVALAAESPFTGTWRVDLGKIQFAGTPETWVVQNGRYQCSTCDPKIDIKADGTDQALVGSKYYDTMAIKIVDDKTIEQTTKKGGKVNETMKCVVSADGKTLTIDFIDYPPGSKPVTGKGLMTRVTPGPAGSHAFSGSWRTAKLASASENALMITYKATVDGLMMSTPTGQSYDAKFDGKDYAVKGDPGGSMVSLKKINEYSVEETMKSDGKVLVVNTMVVSADGKTLTVKSENKERGGTTTIVAVKQ